jgi:hypothetical protein
VAFDEAQRIPHRSLMSEFDLRSGVGVGLTGVSRSRDEDQRLGSTVDGRPHPVRDPTIPAALHPPIELASFRPHGRLDVKRRIEFARA